MEDIAARLLSGKRKCLFGYKPLFEPYRVVSKDDLSGLERKLHARLPAALRSWLLLVGYGDIAEELSFRAEWFKHVDSGVLKGNVLFAQDALGNFYSFDPGKESIHFFSRSEPEYAMLAPNFRVFMEEVERRGFHVLEWVESLPALPYDWSDQPFHRGLTSK